MPLGASGDLCVAEGEVTHHDGQPIIVEVGVLKVFPQALDTTREKEERQDTCVGKVPRVRAALLQTPLSARIPGGPRLCKPRWWPLPTPPTTSSFPKKSNRSVTLSRTTTLQWDARQPGVRSW